MFITWMGGRFFIKNARNKQFNSFSLWEEITSLALRIYFFHVVNSVTKARNYDFNLKGTRPHTHTIFVSCQRIEFCPVFWTHRYTFSWSRKKFPVQFCLGFSEINLILVLEETVQERMKYVPFGPKVFTHINILIDLDID